MKIKTAILIVTIFILASVMCLRLAYADPYSADSMWIDPSEIDITEMSVGDKFNVTVWLNVTEDCGAWQFYLIYNKEYLNVTRYGLTGTGGAKSEFFENSGSSTFFPTPSMGAYNDTHNYILIGESWLGGPFGTGCGSLAWVELNTSQTTDKCCVGHSECTSPANKRHTCLGLIARRNSIKRLQCHCDTRISSANSNNLPWPAFSCLYSVQKENKNIKSNLSLIF